MLRGVHWEIDQYSQVVMFGVSLPGPTWNLFIPRQISQQCLLFFSFVARLVSGTAPLLRTMPLPITTHPLFLTLLFSIMLEGIATSFKEPTRSSLVGCYILWSSSLPLLRFLRGTQTLGLPSLLIILSVFYISPVDTSMLADFQLRPACFPT